MISRVPGAGWLQSGSSAFVLLVLVTVVPSACVVWFMNEALAGESQAARQQVLDAYRGQLRLVRSRLDVVWRAQAARLDGGGAPAAQFARLVDGQLAEGVIVLDAEGHVVFPRVDPELAASAPAARADLERRVAAIASLAGPAHEAAIREVADRLNDYSTPLPPAARLKLMDRLREFAPNVWLTTQAALRLSFDLLDVERPMPAAGVVRKTALADVWALTSADGRVIGLYRTGRIEAMMHDFLHEISPAGIVFLAYPPDVRADAEAVAAGPWLPGWQLSFAPLDLKLFDEAVQRRRTLYVSVAIAGIGLIALVAVAAAGGLRRHLRLARLRTDLAAAASHELRTPLASMRVLVDGLLADPSLDPAKTREYLELLATENARLSRLIDNFLTFARLDRRRYQFGLSPVAPATIVEAAVETVRDRVPAACDFRVEIEDSLPAIDADAEALTAALANLLDNAVKYTPEEKRIAVRVRREPDGWIAFAVIDNGIGIASRERRRIFRRFYQVDRRLSRDTGGVGLGLSIVDSIVRGHRGRVEVESEPGRGSAFTIRLPPASTEAVA